MSSRISRISHSPHSLHPLAALLQERIAIIDGAMGTTIRSYSMKESDIRGERFAKSKKDLPTTGTSSRSRSPR
jgi:methionine synthase I (cobalamin-dependent)